MGNPIEKSLDNFADIAKLIMEKAVKTGELTQADIIILTMYQKEKARATAVPTYKKIIGGVKEITAMIGKIIPKETSPAGLEEYHEIEVDTDAI